jgi:hypothetical protein
MMPDMSPRRRALLQALASVVLVSASRVSFGAKNDDSPDKAGPDKTEPGKAAGKAGKLSDEEKAGKGAAKKGKNAALTLVVTGNGKPIAQAEVKLFKFPPGVGGELTTSTNPAGEASFNSAGTGAARVRVIAAGWVSVRQEVELKEGPQRLTIKLDPLP